MNQVTPPSGVKGSAPVSPAPKSNVAVEPGEQFYERALRRRIRSWPDVSAAGFLTVELSYLIDRIAYDKLYEFAAESTQVRRRIIATYFLQL